MSSSNVGKQNVNLVPPVNQNNDPIISGSTVIRMLFYTFLMVTVPISSYFLSKKMIYEDVFQYSEDSSAIPAALTAVTMIHVVLGLFVYAAYTEDIPSKKKQA